MNKRGNFIILLGFFIIVGILLSLGLFLAFGAAIIDMVADEIVPEISGIGLVGSSNITEYSDYSIKPVNTVIQSFTWLGGLAYALSIILLFGLAFAARFTMGKWLIGIFFVFAILLIFCSIFISNIYEDFYNENDDFGTRLKEQTLLSYLILHSPIVFSIVIFITGIIMFTGTKEGEFI